MSSDDELPAQKFAASESKALLKVHAQNIYNWAQNSTETVLTQPIKEALLTTISRMYELVDGIDDGPKAKVLKKITDDPSGVPAN